MKNDTNVSNIAPVVVFVYNRPKHTKRLIGSLKRNNLSKETDLYIFSDDTKITGNSKKDDICKENVTEVRAFLYSITGFKSVNVIQRDENYGLAKNVTKGIDEVLKKYDRLIVLEDDLEVSSSFLEYMNRALIKYNNNQRVYSISGYSFIGEYQYDKVNQDTYFLPITCSWAWATWRDKWKCYDENAKGWEILNYRTLLRFKFNFDNSYDFYHMLYMQMKNDVNSWAIRWYWSVFINKGLTLYPKISYVDNKGFDGSGVHTIGEQTGGVNEFLNEKADVSMPDKIKCDRKINRIVQQNLSGNAINRNIKFLKQTIKIFLGRYK